MRPQGSGLLYKEVELKERDYAEVARAIAAAWDVEEGSIVSIIKGGDTAFESDSDAWRLANGDSLEFVAGGREFFDAASAAPTQSAQPRHSLQMDDDDMV